jgi:hypothetical protein
MRAPDGKVRRTYAELAGLLDNLSPESLVTKQNAAESCSAGSASPSPSMPKGARPSA